MNKKFVAICLATLMSATVFAGLATVSAEEDIEEMFYYEFEIPTDILPKDAEEIENLRQVPHVDLVAYNANFHNIFAETKSATFNVYNAGNIWAQAPWTTDILMDDETAAVHNHIIDLRPGGARFISKMFHYTPVGWHTFQVWTASCGSFWEPCYQNNYSPIQYVWVT